MTITLSGPPQDLTLPEIWPLTPSQRALWFLDNFNRDSSFYVIGLGLDLRGDLKEDALRDAFGDVVERHEALRARFVSVAGRPCQVFVPERPGLEALDLSGQADPRAAAQREIDALSVRPFDLGTEPPFRARLLRLAPKHHVLAMAVHHIVFDGWSTQVLVGDLAAAYRARSARELVGLPPLETTIGQCAASLAREAESGLRPEEAAHWRARLRGAPVIDLPCDFPRPRHRSFTGALEDTELDGALSEAVRHLAAAMGTTPFTVLATAFTTLVSRLSGHDDVVIGIPLSGRSAAETHGLVGFFANTLPLRVDLSDHPPFGAAVRRHHELVTDLLARQHVPFGAVVDAIAARRSANRNPVFDICFQYLPEPTTGADFPGLDVDLIGGRRVASQFDLSCDVHDLGDRMVIAFEYSTELFTRRTIRTHLDSYIRLIRQEVLGQPGPAAAPPAAAADARGPGAATGGLAGIIARQACQRPEAPSVRDAERALTYGALDEAVSATASWLLSHGVKAGDRVGLLMRPSVLLPVALLAVARAGAVCVPADIRTPQARTSALFARAGCQLLLHDEPSANLAAQVAREASLRALLAGPRAWQHPVAGLPEVAPDDPAYIMFTSGSTGQPKGVIVSHGAAVSLAAGAAQAYELSGADVVLQMASPAVDVAVEEFFASWQAGAEVYVHGPLIDDLSALARARGLTVLNLPAALWHEWTRQASGGETRIPPSVRLVIAGSDRVDPRRVREWHAGPGAGIRLLNAYGVTEATVSSAWYDTSRLAADEAHTTRVPIGGPYPGVDLRVLDDQERPVADGAPGELWIGGPGVAIGYLDDPEATAFRFRPDPDHPGRRLYRTGDIVRRLPSGALDFRGRSDSQVKVRGTRVELAEVERVGGQAPGVAGFVADVRTDGQGMPRLVGYLRMAEAGDAAIRERVEQWRQVHDADVFNEAGPAGDASHGDLNSSGWTSSYTGEPIEAAAMAEWRDEMVRRILATEPSSVLEIGCGTGMIALPLTRTCERYVGLDISPRALEYLGERALERRKPGSQVRLIEAAAHDLPGCVSGERPFDVIVVNSVVQYFPGAAYLTSVLESAWSLLAPGGHLVVGDVRDLTLLTAFHLSVQRYRRPGQPDAHLIDAVTEGVETENELCLAPAYFHDIAARLPGATEVAVLTKAGRAETEMNGFRYDVVIRRAADDGARAVTAPATVVSGHDLTLAGVERVLRQQGQSPIVLRGVPDARVAGLRQSAGATTGSAGVHPADVALAATRHKIQVRIGQAGDGLLDIALSGAILPRLDQTAQPVVNDPLQSARRRGILTAVREHFDRALPKAMIPSRLVVVPSFPLTTSGKVDRSRLPDPPRVTGAPGSASLHGETEQAIGAAWRKVLGLGSVGSGDNFFEIGGDSISWLQIMSRCAKSGIALTARDVFEHQTIAALAAAVRSRGKASREGAVPAGTTEAGLAPIQHWMIESFSVGRDRQNQTQWFELADGCPAQVVRQAIGDVCAHHPVLSEHSFTAAGGHWRQQRRAPAGEAGPRLREVLLPPVGLRRDESLATHDEETQACLSVLGGPLSRAVLYRTPDGEPDLLQWCVHHLVIDAVSWRFLAEDLDTALTARLAGTPPTLPAATMDYLDWAQWSAQAAEAMPAQEAAYWQDVAAAPGLALPVTSPQGSACYAAAHHERRVVPGGQARLKNVPGTVVHAAILLGVRAALSRHLGTTRGSVWLESHGRSADEHEADVSRTAGWFTALYPFVLEDMSADALAAALTAVPASGAGYGRARYLAGAALDTTANVAVNYLGAASAAGPGALASMVAPPGAATAPGTDPDAAMPFALEVNVARESTGALTIEITGCARHLDRARTAHLADILAAEISLQLLAVAVRPDLSLLPAATRDSTALRALTGPGAEIAAAYPLTQTQQLMLNRHLFDPVADANYNESVIDLHGRLDPELLRSAWDALAQRHEVLRTSVEWAGLPEPVHLVRRRSPEALRVLDWTALSPARVERRLAALLEEERTRPPALCGTPPFRLTLVRITAEESRLLWIDHHILLDGWSSQILIRELLAAYASLAAGREAFTESAAPVSFRAFVRWRQEISDTATAEYWQDALAGFSAPTELPFTRQPSVVTGRAGDYRVIDRCLPPHLMAALRLTAARQHTTAGSVLAAGWSAFLHRFTGDQRVSFGMALSGRPATLGDVTSMVGLYLTTLPLQVQVSPGQSGADLLADVTRQGWRLGEVAPLSTVGDIHAWTAIPPSRTLFHSVLVIQNFGGGGPEGPAGTDSAPVTARMAHGNLLTGAPLTIVVVPQTGDLRLVYDTRAFTEQAVRTVLDGLEAILAALAADPRCPLAALPMPRFTLRQQADAPEQPYHPPFGPVEEQIAQAWGDILGMERLGRDVNVFELGANSVAAARLHARLAELYDVGLAVSDLFLFPTVAAMAASISDRLPANARGAATRERGARRRAALSGRPPATRSPRSTDPTVTLGQGVHDES